MAKEEIDVRAERAKIMVERQKKIDAKYQDEIAQRATVNSGFDNPPSVRATDGGEIGTKERNPLEVAAENDSETSHEEAPKMTKAEIKKALDEQGIAYDPKASKEDLQALLENK